MGKTHYFDYTPPGVLLNDQLLGRGLSPEDLAEMCGYSIDKINGVIRGDEHVDETVARQFELSLGIDADLWLNIESNYISHLRRGLEVQYRELAKRGYVPVLSKKELTQRIPNLMAFFGVDCDDALVAWRRRMKVTADAVAYRHSPKFDSDAVAVAAWLRMGSFDAPDEVPEFSEERFKSALNTIRALTSREPSMWDKTIEEAAQLCHESGVVLSVVKPLKDVALDGAFRWLDDRKKKGIIQLSARWKKDDRFWFSLFHEAGHILLPLENARINGLDAPMWEFESDAEDSDSDDSHERKVAEQEEMQVDAWAADFLIPSEEWDRFRNHRRYTSNTIRSFADDMGIAPGIVAGRLQKETEHWKSTMLNRLKVPLKWEDSEGSPPRLRVDVG